MNSLKLLPVVILSTSAMAMSAEDGERANYFEDPFLQVTNAIEFCPEPEGPKVTQAQVREEAHGRTQRGTSCFQSGRCRLPSAYLYDKEIIPRVKKALLADGRFSDTSVWVEGQRRWVWLKGCVNNLEQALSIEQVVRDIDDVEVVINQLTVDMSQTQIRDVNAR